MNDTKGCKRHTTKVSLISLRKYLVVRLEENKLFLVFENRRSMCYDVAAGTKSALKYAKHRGDSPEIIAELEKQLELWLQKEGKHYHASGFIHPELMVFTNEKPFQPQAYVWGLIPHWVRLRDVAMNMMKQTLNARAETLFEKPSFKESAQSKRCLVYIDAFYEHHHFGGKAYPFHISMKDGSPLSIAGIWDEWLDRDTGEVFHTVSMVTTGANDMMKRIHNNPRSENSRMPVILPRGKQEEWLSVYRSREDEYRLQQLLVPFDEDLLEYHTVRRIRGPHAMGNVPEAADEFVYEELSEFNR